MANKKGDKGVALIWTHKLYQMALTFSACPLIPFPTCILLADPDGTTFKYS